MGWGLGDIGDKIGDITKTVSTGGISDLVGGGGITDWFAPDTPNYGKIAQQQGDANRRVTEQQTWANRPTQKTPWGTSSWTSTPVWDPTTEQYVNKWTQNLRLDPKQQYALDNQMKLQSQRSHLARDLFGDARQAFGQPIQGPTQDWGMFGDPSQFRQAAEDATYDRIASRLDPRFEQEQQRMEAQLRGQGLRPGDEAFDTAMGNFDRARNDAYENAALSAVRAGSDEAESMFGMYRDRAMYDNQLRQAQIAEEMQRRGWTLNEINALMTGQQVAQPSMPGFQQATRAQSAPIMEGFLGQQNAQAMQDQAFWSGLAGIGQGAGMFALACDRRLKRHIKRLGTVMGYPFYSFQYLWGDWAMGFMADEVNPEAVITTPGGLQMVDVMAIQRPNNDE